MEAGVSRGSAGETKGLPDSTPALELSNLFKRGRGEETEEAPDEKKSEA